MLSWINQKIDNLLQPELLRSENLGTLPPGEYIPVPSDIVIPSMVTAFFFVVIRFLFDRFLVYPFGTYLGVKDSTSNERLFHHPVLENEYRKSRNPEPTVLTIISKKTGFTEKHIQIWFRKRKRQDNISDLKKLSDSGWSFFFYFTISWYGIYVLWDKPWITKTENCWRGWPMQTISTDVYWYYLLELGYYMSYLHMLFTDHKRKDFMEFFIHHIVTVILMILSWSHNVVRIGTLVLCIHDPVDYILAVAKSASYCKKQGVADVCFAIFLPIWFVTRLFVYPYIVLYTVYIELSVMADDSKPYLQYLNTSTIGHLLRALLVVLQILHVLWTIHILKSAATKFTKGKLEDARSDTEDESQDEEDDENVKNEYNKIFNNSNN